MRKLWKSSGAEEAIYAKGKAATTHTYDVNESSSDEKLTW